MSGHDLPALKREMDKAMLDLKRMAMRLDELRCKAEEVESAMYVLAYKYDRAALAYQDAKAEVEGGC